MELTLELDREDDGRWIADVPELPGVLAYGNSAQEAVSKSEVLALRVIADRIERSEAAPVPIHFSLPAALIAGLTGQSPANL
jgi:predicted RNase H-like HicB family nuclease